MQLFVPFRILLRGGPHESDHELMTAALVLKGVPNSLCMSGLEAAKAH